MEITPGDSTPERVRRRILRLLDAGGIKKGQLAKAVGRQPSWASMYLRGDRPFPFARIDDVARLFHLTPAELVDRAPAEAFVWHIGDVVRKVRRERGLSRVALAQRAEIDADRLEHLEAEGVGSPATMKKVALALGVPVASLERLLPATQPTGWTEQPRVRR